MVVKEHGWKDGTQGSLSLSWPGALWKAFLPGGGTALLASTEGLLSADLPTSTFVLKLGVDVYQSSGDRVQRFCFPKRVCDSEKVTQHRSQVSSTQSYCAAPKGTGFPIPENGMNQDGLVISEDLFQAP